MLNWNRARFYVVDSANIEQETIRLMHGVEFTSTRILLTPIPTIWQYRRNQKFAKLQGNAKLTDSKMILYTRLFYETKERFPITSTMAGCLRLNVIVVKKGTTTVALPMRIFRAMW